MQIVMIDLNDLLWYLLAVIYAVLVLLAGDLGRRRLGLDSNFTRKIIHLFAGFAIWTVPFYTHAWVATFVALTFVIMLIFANSKRFGRFFAAMARQEDLAVDSVRGPLWYAVSITLLTGIFTFTGRVDIYFIAAASIHMMMLGDGLSAPIGLRYGKKHMYTFWGSQRSIHGSASLFMFSLIGALLAFWFFGVLNYGTLIAAGQILWGTIIQLALIGAVAATVIEILSPKGTDNLTVPLLSAVVMLITGIYMGIVII